MLEQVLCMPKQFYRKADLTSLSTLILYTGPVRIRDFPSLGFQLHLHGPNLNSISYGKIVDYNRNTLKTLNGYEASMADLNADLLKIKKIDLSKFF